jgi:hypothetical protein
MFRMPAFEWVMLCAVGGGGEYFTQLLLTCIVGVVVVPLLLCFIIIIVAVCCWGVFYSGFVLMLHLKHPSFVPVELLLLVLRWVMPYYSL